MHQVLECLVSPIFCVVMEAWPGNLCVCLTVSQMRKGWLIRISHHLDGRKRLSGLATQMPVCTTASRSYPFSVAMSLEPRVQSLSLPFCGRSDSLSPTPFKVLPTSSQISTASSGSRHFREALRKLISPSYEQCLALSGHFPQGSDEVR